MLPSAELAYETGLSAGSIAMLAHGHQKLDPPPGVASAFARSYGGRAELARLPSERIADNALWALKMACRAVARQGEGWSARDDLHVQGCLILSQVGLLFPVNHAPLKLASLIRLRSEATADGSGFD